MDTQESIVRMENVHKVFGANAALGDVNLTIGRGSIVGLLGANGAGKSTLLRTMIGLYLPDAGRCMTFGTEVGKLGPEQFARIGYVHQEGELLHWMTAGQLVRYVATYYPGWNDELERRYVKDFDISLRDRVGSLSPGQRQKLAILLAIGFEPELLILDEPASALDPIARARFLNLLLELIQDQCRTIIISSHILSDVEKVIDHVIIMKNGAILRDCGFDDLREGFCSIHLSSLHGDLPSELPFENVVSCQRGNGQAVLIVQERDVGRLRQQALSLDCWVDCEPMSLEQIYEIVVG